jgi:hypothetical protein
MGHVEPESEVATLNRPSNDTAWWIGAAERELGAFLAAVRQKFGSDAASQAAEYWLEALEAAALSSKQPRTWRDITIQASSRVAKGLDISAHN